MIFTQSPQSCPICDGDNHFSCDLLSPFVAFITGGVTLIIWNALEIYKYMVNKDGNKDKTSYKKWDMIYGLCVFIGIFSWSSLFLGGIQMNFQITFFFIMGFFALFTFFDPKYTLGFKYDKDIKNSPEDEKLQARDIYQDFTTSFVRCFFIFILQIMLIFLYVLSVWRSGKPCFANSIQYIYYVLGVIASAIYHVFENKFSEKKMKNDGLLWKEMYDVANNKGSLICENDGEDGTGGEISPYDWYSRRTMSILVNVYAANLIQFLLPLQVAQSDKPLDFVLNVVAAKYIMDLDNHSTWDSDPKSFTICQPATQDENGADGGADGKSYHPVSLKETTAGRNDTSDVNA
jgi:hypothetical protein